MERYKNRKKKYNFGKPAREWRSVLCDDRNAKPTRTLQFPLEHGELSDNIIDNACNTYAKVRGFGEHSLQRFLNALLLSGFRLFDNEAKARHFAQEPGYTLESGAIAFDTDAVYGGENIMSSVLSSPMQMQITYAHCKNKPCVAYDQDKETKQLTKSDKPLNIKKQMADANALSNVFGTTLQMWQNKSADDIQTYYNIPNHQKHIIQPIQDIAKGLAADTFLKTKKSHYADYRKVLQGNIDSWTSNYSKRLDALIQALNTDDEKSISKNLNTIKLKIKGIDIDYGTLFQGIDMDADGLYAFMDGLKAGIADTKTALQNMQGNVDESNFETVADFSESLSLFHGIIASINNNIKQYNDENNLKKKDAIQDIKHELPKKLDKIPHFRGSTLFDKDIYKQQTQTDFKTLLDTIDTQYKKLNPDINALVSVQKKRFHDTTDDFVLQFLFHRFVGSMRNMSDTTKHIFIQYAFDNTWITNKKDINKYLFAHQGAFWRSPKSNSRHQPYTSLNCNAFSVPKIADFLSHFKAKVTDTKSYFEYIQCDFAYKSLCISGLEGDIPNKDFNVKTAKKADGEPLIILSPILKMILNNDVVSSSIAQKIFNTYGSKLRGMIFTLSRTQFMDKITLRRVGDEYLHYIPKDTQWEIPNHIWNTDNPISRALETFGISRNNPIIQVMDIYDQIHKNKTHHTNPDIRALLKQMPHSWGYGNIKTMPYGETKKCCKVERKGNLSFKKNIHVMRLIGASSHKTILDDYLIHAKTEFSVSNTKSKKYKGFQFGTFELVMDIPYTQNIACDKNTGTIDITIKKCPAKLSLNIPVNEVFNGEQHDIQQNIVAIDLGEYGIGYAVFDIADYRDNGTFTIHDSGTIPIPAIRNVKTRATKYRNTQSNKAHFKSNYNNKMEQVRKNAVGDVRNVINTLMKKHNAFPIFETSVDNLESGGNQLKLIYKSIQNYYTFSSTDAHKTLRQWYWNINNPSIKTDIPVYENIEWDAHHQDISNLDTIETKKETLKLHPATRVSVAYTSQTCYDCERCATAYIKNTYDKTAQMSVDSNGRVTLQDGSTIRLYAHSKQDEKSQLRTPMTNPLKSDNYKRDDLIKHIKKNMRRPHISKNSKDTSQSRFFCVYGDCKNHQKLDGKNRINGIHADENAAKNIGKRFLKTIKK